jgi:hypothetical protein
VLQKRLFPRVCIYIYIYIALDRTMWRARFERRFGPVVTQTTWMNEYKESIRFRLLIQIQQRLRPSHQSNSRHFVLLCTEMAALMNTVYDGYRYIFHECAGKKLTPRHWPWHVKSNIVGLQCFNTSEICNPNAKILYAMEFKWFAITWLTEHRNSLKEKFFCN